MKVGATDKLGTKYTVLDSQGRVSEGMSTLSAVSNSYVQSFNTGGKLAEQKYNGATLAKYSYQVKEDNTLEKLTAGKG